MSRKSLVELADTKSRQRAVLFGVAGLVFLAVQVLVHPAFGNEEYAHGWRMYSWAFNEVLLLLCLGGGGGMMNARPLRDLINDEVARSNYRLACSRGFWVSVSSALLLYVIPAFAGFTGHQVTYVVVTLSTVTALLTFSWLEYRAHADA